MKAADDRGANSFGKFVDDWNEAQSLVTPALHGDMIEWLEGHWHGGGRELVLLAFRNSGKSTLVGLFAAWLLASDSNLRILVQAADHALARKMVRNVKRIIERHPATAHLKPTRADQWASDQFTVNRSAELRDPSMLAKGVTANVTGSRADVVICDDVEVPNTCDTAAKRLDLRERLSEIEYVLVPGGLQLYIGTPHSYYSIYSSDNHAASKEEKPFLTGYRRMERPLLENDGSSAWPERFSLNKIEAIRRRTGPNKFASQMMLRPVDIAEGRLNADRLVAYDHGLQYREANGHATLTVAGRKLVSVSCWWDPAYGAPGIGDASVVAALYSDTDGVYWLHRVQYLHHKPVNPGDDQPAEATQLCRQVVRFAEELYLPSVTVETNGLGRFLPGLLRQAFAEQGLPVAVVEVASKRSKDIRIVDAFDAVLADGRLRVHHSVWETPFIAEMREWRPGGRGRDDGLDAVAGCLLSEPVRLPRRVPVGGIISPRANWRHGATPYRVKSEFDV